VPKGSDEPVYLQAEARVASESVGRFTERSEEIRVAHDRDLAERNRQDRPHRQHQVRSARMMGRARCLRDSALRVPT
jgi:Arc/MetJ-type ribon-helix-helix transcriptional regulator